MDFWIVAVFSLIYLVASRYIPPFFVDLKKMREVREKHAAVTKEMLEAFKAQDAKRMDEATKKQEEVNKEMFSLLIEQVKYSLVLVALFFVFIQALNYLDPLTKDDQTGKVIKLPKAKLCYLSVGGKKYFIESGNFSILPKEINVSKENGQFVLTSREKMSSDSCTSTVLWLPFPIMGLRYIHGVASVFIFFSFLFSLVLSPFLPKP
jgi:hypothetical protein